MTKNCVGYQNCLKPKTTKT